MIHYWECDRCTHQWTSCCSDHIFETRDMGEEEKRKKLRYKHRQLVSGICPDCFDMLEAGEIEGLPLFDFYEHLDRKADNIDHGANLLDGFVHNDKYSGMCHEYVSATYNEDGSEKTPSNFVSGETAELKQLRAIRNEIKGLYKDVILAQRTAKRIELDEWKKDKGFYFFGPQPRPEGFEGDPPGKPRTHVVFGFDPRTGNIYAPSIEVQNGQL